jgi:hypothetical protein
MPRSLADVVNAQQHTLSSLNPALEIRRFVVIDSIVRRETSRGRRRKMTMTDAERRSQASAPLKPGAMRCTDCGTTWFDQLAHLAVRAGRSCRRCGGLLHVERRARRTEQPA